MFLLLQRSSASTNLFDELFLCLSIFFNHHANVTTRIQRIILLLYIGLTSALAQTSYIFVFGFWKALLQPLDVLVEKLRIFYFCVQLLQRGLERAGLAVYNPALPVFLRLLELALSVLANDLIELLQTFMQSTEEGIEKFSQLILRLVLLHPLLFRWNTSRDIVDTGSVVYSTRPIA